ncbi:MAG TPA: hypothetical protein VF898_00550 [Chloroflexota bacterium]
MTTTRFVLFPAVLVALIVGAAAMLFADPYLPSNLSNTKKGYDTGFAAAKNLVYTSPVGAIYRMPDDVRAFSGTVTAVGADQFTIHTPSQDPFLDPALNDRIVHIDSSTMLFKMEPKDPKVYQKEMTDYSALVRAATTTLSVQPPAPFTKTAVSLSSLSKNQPVTVTTAENVRDANEFTATEVDIQAQAAAR